MMDITLRDADAADLDALNAIIESAIMTWDLPDRVKRLSLPSYKYDAFDLKEMEIVLAECGTEIRGVAAWGKSLDGPDGEPALLLHGIYVAPRFHHRGIGRRLFRAAEAAALAQACAGVLVKAQRGSEAFYLSMGMDKLVGADTRRDFENRFWKPVV